MIASRLNRMRLWVGSVVLGAVYLQSSLNVLAAPDSQDENKNAEFAAVVERVIATLPSDTESLIVTGAVSAASRAPTGEVYDPLQGAKKVKRSLRKLVLNTTTSLFGTDAAFKQLCRNSDIQATIFGARRFETIEEIGGGTTYEGCQIVIFDPQIRDTIDAMFAAASKSIGTIPILQKPTNEPWGDEALTILFASPLPGVVVAATSSKYLEQFLASFSGKQPSEAEFSRPKWPAAMTEWGMRRYRVPGSENSPSSFLRVDKGAQWLVFGCDENSGIITIRYHSDGKNAQHAFVQSIKSLLKKTGIDRRIDDSTYEASIEEGGKVWFGVVALMGFVAFP